MRVIHFLFVVSCSLLLYVTSGQHFDTDDKLKKGDIPLLNRKAFDARRRQISEHPYIANILRQYGHFLVGSIIAERVIVTVAEPLISVSVDELSICCGQSYTDRGSVLHTVIMILRHSMFSAKTMSNDVALLRIYNAIDMRNEVKPIAIANSYFDLDSKYGFVSGWARCDFTGEEFCLPRKNIHHKGEVKDPMLRTAYVPIQGLDHLCRTKYRQYNIELQPGMLCAGEARHDNKMAACLAAPGAPLVVDGYLLGIQSWGLGCGYQNDLPTVYTDLRYLGTWVGYNAFFLSYFFDDTIMKVLYDMTVLVRSHNNMAGAFQVTDEEHSKYNSSVIEEALDEITYNFLNVVAVDIRDILPTSNKLSKLRKPKNRTKLLEKEDGKLQKLRMEYNNSYFKMKLYHGYEGKIMHDVSDEIYLKPARPKCI